MVIAGFVCILFLRRSKPKYYPFNGSSRFDRPFAAPANLRHTSSQQRQISPTGRKLIAYPRATPHRDRAPFYRGLDQGRRLGPVLSAYSFSFAPWLTFVDHSF